MGVCDDGLFQKGFALMVFQILIFPHLANSLGLMMTTRVPAVREKLPYYPSNHVFKKIIKSGFSICELTRFKKVSFGQASFANDRCSKVPLVFSLWHFVGAFSSIDPHLSNNCNTTWMGALGDLESCVYCENIFLCKFLPKLLCHVVKGRQLPQSISTLK